MFMHTRSHEVVGKPYTPLYGTPLGQDKLSGGACPALEAQLNGPGAGALVLPNNVGVFFSFSFSSACTFSSSSRSALICFCDFVPISLALSTTACTPSVTSVYASASFRFPRTLSNEGKRTASR